MAEGVPERLQEEVPADLDQGSEPVDDAAEAPADTSGSIEEATDEAAAELAAVADDEDLGAGDEPAGGEA